MRGLRARQLRRGARVISETWLAGLTLFGDACRAGPPARTSGARPASCRREAAWAPPPRGRRWRRTSRGRTWSARQPSASPAA